MEKVKENEMGTMPVAPLLVKISVPIVISMMVQAFYNIVDSIFVARLGQDALTAVSLVFPVQNLMIAVAVGTAVGVGSLLSRRLGEQNFELANKTATHGVILSVASWVVFAIAGLLLSGVFFKGYIANPDVNNAVAYMGEDYMRIVTVGSPGLFVSIMYERLLQATGKSVYSMISQLVGAIINIILDPIMIFGLFGFPKMGVSGAALATIIGQMIGMLVGIISNNLKNKEINVSFRGFKLSGTIISTIYKVGLPSIVMQSIGSIMVFVMNEILVMFGTTPVSVLGVYYKLQSFVFMPVFGINNGMVPIVAYNYGARKPERIAQAIKASLKICFGIMVAGLLLFWIMPATMLKMFNADANMIEIGTAALRIISLAFPLAAIGIVLGCAFQALGSGVDSLIISVIRQLAFLLPVAYLLAKFFGLPALWAAFPIAEIVAVVFAAFMFKRLWRKKIRPMEEANKLKSSS